MKIRKLFQGILIGHTLVSLRQALVQAVDLIYELGMIEGTRTGVGLMVGIKNYEGVAYQGYIPSDLYIYAKIIFDVLDEEEKRMSKKVAGIKQGKGSRA